MSNKNDLSVDGVRSDGVGHAPATPEQLAQFKQASEALSRFRAPILVHANNPHEKLFVAAFDGTGNHKYANPAGATNVAKISDQLEAAYEAGSRQVYTHYLVGPGTQSNKLAAGLDGMLGHTYESNLKEMYGHLVEKVDEWKQADPGAVIRLQTIGFSRGASQAAGFTRLVHEQGIPDLDSRTVGADGRLVYGRYHVAPGEIVQTVGLLDPVATGVPMQFDRRLPSSVVSGFQITSADEHRATFPSDQIIPSGLSKDGRFLNVTLPGAHSDIGGAYQRNGLSIRSGNLLIDYCNSARDVPFLEKRYEPQDPRINVIHRSTEGQLVYRLDPREAIRGEPSGTNFRLAPGSAGAGPLPHQPETANAKMMTTVTYRNVPVGHVPNIPERPLPPPVSAAAMEQAGRSIPLAPKLAGAAMGAAMVYDTVKTVHRTSDLLGQDNIPGSQSELMHFSGRTLGGIAGGVAGAKLGGALGMEAGPPGALLLGAIGAAGGAWAGDKIADARDQWTITHQPDSKGQEWHYEEKQGWVRHLPPLPGTPHGQHLRADPALAAQLTYQANSTSAELALARAGTPADPYRQPAGPKDAVSLKDAPWGRSEAGVWTRQVTDQILEHGLSSSHRETASPTRSAELEQAARQTVAENLAYSPRGIAQRYEAAYAQQGWHQFGPMPEAVAQALKVPDNKLMASDGHSYTRGTDGAWSRPGTIYGTHAAEGNIRLELAATYEVSRAARPSMADARASDAKQMPQHDMPATPPASAKPTRLDDLAHPDHGLFQQARGHVQQLDRSMGRTPDRHTDNLAAAATVQARADGLKRIDQIALSEDGSRLWAVQTPPGRNDHLFDLRSSVPTQAANQAIEHSSAQWGQAMQRFHDSQQQAQAQTHAHEQAQVANGSEMTR